MGFFRNRSLAFCVVLRFFLFVNWKGIKMKFSIRLKAVIMIVVFAFVLITLSTGMYARVIVNMTKKQYGERAENLAKTYAFQ